MPYIVVLILALIGKIFHFFVVVTGGLALYFLHEKVANMDPDERNGREKPKTTKPDGKYSYYSESGERINNSGASDFQASSCVMRLVGFIASADKRVSSEERYNAENIINRLNPRYFDQYFNAFELGTLSSYTPDTDIEVIKNNYGNDHGELVIVMSFLVFMALADNNITYDEQERLNYIGRAFGISTSEIKDLIREMSDYDFSDRKAQNYQNYSSSGSSGSNQSSSFYGSGSENSSQSFYSRTGSAHQQNDGNGYSGAENNSNSYGYNRQSSYNSSHNDSSDYYHSYFGSSSPYENAMYLMGISRVTPVNEIKRIYRSMVRKYHPDLVKAKGLPEEMIAVYEKKTKEINEAYDIICKNRNI